MELTIEGTPDEIKKVLQAVGSSEEHQSLQNQLATLADIIQRKVINEL